MEDQIIYLGETLYIILSCLAMPLFWTETLLFWMLHLPTSTSFRMFPRADTVPDYPTTIAYSYVLITIACIPNFVSWDRYMDGRAALGRLLRPLTRGASPITEFSVMFARVWLAAAWVNLAAAQFMTDYNPMSLSVKISCVIFIL